ncbi:5-(carboxyamino)imidazole ribonucleotide synthase [Aurantimonas sp. MSK8Z-1]|uniref:5-(carboxyamino)imidazole ribonucleotide synthase n=1 Tax=Mangrovibrevibacter kandeliae TaxID=2968473 RepID=UPI0021176A21|nr:5-(carboxyamino)imidazole ribonucleotide synthase [Aurantimonas sp. MSK8Z-1]MCW4116228.1 5-(carboxyamino)imidazole ribonucleotide synthase [Aurantimonas sp. MSK8Z-1]
MSALVQGDTIGIVGGGQLGRMLAMAAARLGFDTVVIDPDPACPAGQVANTVIGASYDDATALAQLAERAAVITYEFENVPVAPLRQVAARCPVFPPPDALEVSQDRVTEKAFFNAVGVGTAAWRAIDREEELGHALLELGGDCILKTRRFGYDGKGQASLREGAPYDGVWDNLGGVPAILEKRVRFQREISIIGARGPDGAIALYDPAENVHGNGILRTSSVPATLPPAVADEARALGRVILERLSYVGVIGIEFFVTDDDRLLVNEMAPRVHNSGHWTEAACAVSQFEQHVRAIAGLPLGDTVRHSDCVMHNLIGTEAESAFDLLTEPNLVLHLYGKAESRDGRKMGHFTRLRPRPA